MRGVLRCGVWCSVRPSSPTPRQDSKVHNQSSYALFTPSRAGQSALHYRLERPHQAPARVARYRHHHALNATLSYRQLFKLVQWYIRPAEVF